MLHDFSIIHNRRRVKREFIFREKSYQHLRFPSVYFQIQSQVFKFILATFFGKGRKELCEDGVGVQSISVV